MVVDCETYEEMLIEYEKQANMDALLELDPYWWKCQSQHTIK